MKAVIRSLILIARLAALALLIATIGALLAIITGHVRWIELAWISIAASLLAIVLGQLWPRERIPEHCKRDPDDWNEAPSGPQVYIIGLKLLATRFYFCNCPAPVALFRSVAGAV